MKRYKKDVDPWDIATSSPQSDRSVILQYHGEVRFGPAYYLLWVQVDGEYVGPGETEVYGNKIFWAVDGSYIALERRFSLMTPDNGLLIVDLKTSQQCLLDRFGSGFLDSITWQHDEDRSGCTVIYRTVYYRQDNVPEQIVSEVSIDSIVTWDPILWLNVFGS